MVMQIMQKFPDIQIDYSKCTTPFNCKKCLQVCPQAVFHVLAVKIEKFKETDKTEPGSYRLEPMYRHKCVMCNDCVDVCPESALKVIMP
jgi:NADH-quinone oxidoreductase subunit I